EVFTLITLGVSSKARPMPSSSQSPRHTHLLLTQACRLSRHSLGPAIGPEQLMMGLHSPPLHSVPGGHMSGGSGHGGVSKISIAPPVISALNLAEFGSPISRRCKS